MKILFLHGWQSTPGGVKPTYLKDHGHEVLNPALPDDFDLAVGMAQAEFDQHQPDVVVGSSRGGAVAMNINIGKTPLVLLCPAWKYWGTARTVKPGTIVLHSKADGVVPLVDSQELLRNSALPGLALILLGNENRLADPESLKAIVEACERAVTREMLTICREANRARYRFGIGSLLIITALYAVLFGILRAFEASPLDFVLISMFLAVVGLGQAFLFEGQRPRGASMIVGAGFFVGLFMIHWVLFGIESARHSRYCPFDPVAGAFGGAIFGYIAGQLITGIFLVIDMLKNVKGKWKLR